MNLSVITRPALEPVTTAEAKTHLRVTQSSEDTLIGTLITAARQHVEEYLRRALVTQTLEYKIPGFGERIILPRPQLQYVVSVKYLDSDEAEQTLASTYWIEHAPTEDFGYLQRAPQKTWPAVAARDDAVRIRYVAGYPDPGSPTDGVGGVPEAINQAILLMVGDMFENREAQAETVLNENRTVMALLAPYRNYSL